VRGLTPIFNLYGTVTLVGGALYSAWIFWRKRILLHRVLGNLMIAAGALLPAFGGAFSRFGVSGVLYLSELLGAILLFLGFLRATTPMGGEASGGPEPAG
jgi:vacuolar-type H+-ATPase subunit I/STV1